jgi:hypothetical protein
VRAGLSLQAAMAAARRHAHRKKKGRHHGKKTSAGKAASHRAALAARATASTGNSRLLTKWRNRCAKLGKNTNECKLIKSLAEDQHVVMDKHDAVVVMVAAATRYSISRVIDIASNK